MKTPSKKAIRQSQGIMSKRTLTFVKKARKQMRKLRKAAIANAQNDVLGWTEKQIETFDKMLSVQKKLRDAETNEPKQ